MSDAQKLPALPAITSPLSPDMKMWIDSATAIITALTAQNPKASGLDAAITFRDIVKTTGAAVTAVQGAKLNVKPVIDIKSPLTSIIGGAVASVNARAGAVVLDKSDVGLSNADNTSDANKPVSIAQASAIGAKENTGVAASLDAYHVAVLDPHTQYVLRTSVAFPFYSSSSISDTIPLTSGGTFPFYDSTGTVDNIPMTL